MFLNENLGHLTLIVEKQHLNYLSVGSISLHNLGTFVTFVEPYLIILMQVRLERIYPYLLTYSIPFSLFGPHYQYINKKIVAFLTLGMVLLRSEKTWDKLRMRLPQLYRGLQDTNTTDELMLFIPAISSTLSRASSSNVHFTTDVMFLPIAPRGLSERDYLKINFIPLWNNRKIKLLLQMIVLSHHIVCLDRLQSKLAYTKVMH